MAGKFYSVCYVHGSSGSMMVSLLEKIISKDLDKPFAINQWNNAHQNVYNPNVTFNWQKVGRDGMRAGSVFEYFENMVVINDENNVYFQTHWFHPKAIWGRFPDARVVLITHTLEDVQEIAINNFFKFVVGEFDGNGSGKARGTYYWMRRNSPHLFNTPEHTKPKDLPIEEQRAAVQVLEGLCIGCGYHLVTIPEEYKDKICRLWYRDIINNPDQTLQKLSEFLETEVNDFAREQYYGYCERQKIFIKNQRERLGL